MFWAPIGVCMNTNLVEGPLRLSLLRTCREWLVLKFIERNWHLAPLTPRSRDNLPNPMVASSNPYVPLNMPAIGDLFEMFEFGQKRGTVVRRLPPSSVVRRTRRSAQGHHGRSRAVAVALHHREALAGVDQREGQAAPAFRLPIHLLVRPVDEPDGGRVREGQHDGVAVCGGRVPGVHRLDDTSRRALRPWLGHHNLLRVRGSPRGAVPGRTPPSPPGRTRLCIVREVLSGALAGVQRALYGVRSLTPRPLRGE
jgi:hypothetical protein